MTWGEGAGTARRIPSPSYAGKRVRDRMSRGLSATRKGKMQNEATADGHDLQSRSGSSAYLRTRREGFMFCAKRSQLADRRPSPLPSPRVQGEGAECAKRSQNGPDYRWEQTQRSITKRKTKPNPSRTLLLSLRVCLRPFVSFVAAWQNPNMQNEAKTAQIARREEYAALCSAWRSARKTKPK
jgi:hypothetical protein